jgi:protein involved in polysaccharide export with SLBB domain
LLSCVLSGCAALTNPLVDGIPVTRLSPEFQGVSKEGMRLVPINLLRQPPPDVYRLAGGDILGVWIEGVLGEKQQPPPMRLPERGDLPPAIGYPIPVRENGTIALPFVSPVKVQGLSVDEAQEAIRKAYTVDKQILKSDQRIIVTLMRRRQYHVLVFRQDAGGSVSVNRQEPLLTLGPASSGAGLEGTLGVGNRSAGFAVDLPAYENDVLNALAQSGGLPSLESANEIIIQRGSFGSDRDRAALMQELSSQPSDRPPPWPAGTERSMIRIPLRVRPGEDFTLRPEDIVLNTGDIIYLPTRPLEVFYAGGLLPAGEYPLPRDHDVDVLQAVAKIRGPLVNGAFGANNISGAIVASGIGGPSPSLLTVLRRSPDGGQVRVRVDLNCALRDPRERLLVQAGDFLILQETPGEALTRYFTEMFKFNLVYQLIHGRHETGTINVVVP